MFLQGVPDVRERTLRADLIFYRTILRRRVGPVWLIVALYVAGWFDFGVHLRAMGMDAYCADEGAA